MACASSEPVRGGEIISPASYDGPRTPKRVDVVKAVGGVFWGGGGGGILHWAGGHHLTPADDGRRMTGDDGSCIESSRLLARRRVDVAIVTVGLGAWPRLQHTQCIYT